MERQKAAGLLKGSSEDKTAAFCAVTAQNGSQKIQEHPPRCCGMRMSPQVSDV